MSRPTVHLVAAAGGHLELLLCVRAAFDGHDRTWVTEQSARASALAREGERVVHLQHYGRRPAPAIANLRIAAALVRQDRPATVVCSGSGVTVPFCLLARAAGARVVYAETMARVSTASATGRVLSRIADHVFVQWPDMAAVYATGEVCRPALLERIGRREVTGTGTFVAVGTWKQPFDRLLSTVDEAAGLGVLPGPVAAQTGVSAYRPRNFAGTPFLPPAALEDAISRAAVVIGHAGSGVIATALRAGRRPLVLPRLSAAGEHVDDHQLQIARRLDAYGLVRLIDGAVTDADVVAALRPLPAEMPDTAGRRLEDAIADRLVGLAR